MKKKFIKFTSLLLAICVFFSAMPIYAVEIADIWQNEQETVSSDNETPNNDSDISLFEETEDDTNTGDGDITDNMP